MASFEDFKKEISLLAEDEYHKVSCETSLVCTNCNTCNVTVNTYDGPDSCGNRCNVCNSCNGTPTGCFNAQYLCETCQQAKEYLVDAGAPQPEKDQIIIKQFSQASLNALIDWIKAGQQLGQAVKSPSFNVSHESKDFIYADKINDVVDGMYNISRYNNFRDFERDDIIYADEFKNLMTEINNLYINKRACHTCNTTCNSTCNNCNECNICESNDTCIFGQCRGCDTCQGCDSACNQCISCQNCNTTQYY